MSPLEKLFSKTAQLTVLEYLMKNKGEINYIINKEHKAAKLQIAFYGELKKELGD